MKFGLGDERKPVVRTVREFVGRELYPLETQVERSGELPRAFAEKRAPVWKER